MFKIIIRSIIIIATVYAGIKIKISNIEHKKNTSEKTVNFTARNTTNMPNKDIQKAINIFRDNCYPLMDKYTKDIKEAKIFVYEGNWGYWYEDYNWARHIKIEIEIKEAPQYIPNSYRAWGNTLHYMLGSGNRPGIIAKKKQSQDLCGMTPPKEGWDAFKDEPKLNFIDDTKVPVKSPS